MTGGFPGGGASDGRDILAEVLDEAPDAVLIGGWGTWMRTGGPTSHDIDLIVTQTDLARFRLHVSDLSESRHIARRKWRGTWRGMHLDLYVPFQSVLGDNLALRVERLAGYTERVRGRRLLTVDAHITTKMEALLGRAGVLPGDKDRSELLALFQLGGDGVPSVLLDVSPHSPAEIADLVDEAFVYLGETRGLTRKDRDWLRRVRGRWVRELESR